MPDPVDRTASARWRWAELVAAFAAFDRGLRESVQRATPFPPLPETIRKQADLLVVTLQLPER